MKPIPTLRQLRYLVAVVEHCHFGRAAEVCLVGQSTLSAGIQELEELLGVSLLERTRRSVVPTALGLEIAGRARGLLQGAEELADLAQAARDPMAGKLRLGVIPTIGPFLLPQVLPGLRADFPDLRLYLVEEQTARVLARLMSGDLDAVLLALPYPLDAFETVEVGLDEFSLVCPPGHRLCAATTVQASDVAMEDLLLLEDGHCMREHALAACALDSGHRSPAFQGTSLHTLVQMVANGLGVTLVPQMALDAGILRGLDLAVRPVAGATPFRRIGLTWRRSSGRAASFRRLAAALRDGLAGMALRGCSPSP
jgi:LysR family hydrogen peroxide-inducible transcriptional activator